MAAIRRSPARVDLLPDPPVVEVGHALEERGGQLADQTGGRVGLRLTDVASTRDDRRDARLLPDPRDRGLRGGDVEPGGPDERGELLRRLDAGGVVDAGEGLADVEGAAVAVVGAVVVGGERRVEVVLPGQQAGGR